MGVCFAPALFQNTIDRIIHDLNGVHGYLDDVIFGECTR